MNEPPFESVPDSEAFATRMPLQQMPPSPYAPTFNQQMLTRMPPQMPTQMPSGVQVPPYQQMPPQMESQTNSDGPGFATRPASPGELSYGGTRMNETGAAASQVPLSHSGITTGDTRNRSKYAEDPERQYLLPPLNKKKKKSTKPSWLKLRQAVCGDLPDLLLPWLFFALIFWAFAMQYYHNEFLAWLSLGVALVLSVAFVFLSEGLPWQIIAVFCFLTTVLAGVLGFTAFSTYMRTWYLYGAGTQYFNVYPNEDPGAKVDAVQIHFSAGAHIDWAKSAGYRSGDLYCAAPVVGLDSVPGSNNTQPLGAAAPKTVGFWAVGRNCCAPRGKFRCAMENGRYSKRADGGFVVMDDIVDWQVYQAYESAVTLAAGTYGLALPSKPMYVQWSNNAKGDLNAMRAKAVDNYRFVFWVAFCITAFFALAYVIAGFSISEVSARWARPFHWHTLEALQMRKGFDLLDTIDYPKPLQRDLVYERCYWSGAIIHDYVFHVANTNIFFACFLSHPGHPYTKLRRFALLLILALLTLFLSAAVAASIDGDEEWRTQVSTVIVPLLVVVLATFPRSLIKMRLQEAFEEDTIRKNEVVWWKEPLGYGIAFLFTLIICIICAVVIRIKLCDSSGQCAVVVFGELWQCAVALVFAIVLELAVDLIMPTIGFEQHHDRWYLGFIDRWVVECKTYKSEPWRVGSQYDGFVPA